METDGYSQSGVTSQGNIYHDASGKRFEEQSAGSSDGEEPAVNHYRKICSLKLSF